MTTSDGSEKNCAKKKTASLPPETVEYLKAWMMSPEHVAHPYPTETEKNVIMAETGIELKQLTNWFVNNRKRYWKPRVEARLKQQREQARVAAASCIPVPTTVSLTHNVESSSARVSPVSPDVSPTITRDSQACFSLFNLGTTGGRAVPSMVSLSDSSHAPSTDSSDDSICSNDDDESNSMKSVQLNAGRKEESCLLLPKFQHTTEEDVVDEFGIITRKEVVDVHILKPMSESQVGLDFDRSSLPTIKDVTILTPKEEQQVLRSFKFCPISYTFHESLSRDRKKVQSRRDAEVVRVKKSVLRQYLFDVGAGSFRTIESSKLADKADNKESCESNQYAEIVETKGDALPTECAVTEVAPLVVAKKMRIISEGEVVTKTQPQQNLHERAKFVSGEKIKVAIVQEDEQRKFSNDEGTTFKWFHERQERNAWRDACRNARHGYEEDLPTLEEAANLFGYTRL